MAELIVGAVAAEEPLALLGVSLSSLSLSPLSLQAGHKDRPASFLPAQGESGGCLTPAFLETSLPHLPRSQDPGEPPPSRPLPATLMLHGQRTSPLPLHLV